MAAGGVPAFVLNMQTIAAIASARRRGAGRRLENENCLYYHFRHEILSCPAIFRPGRRAGRARAGIGAAERHGRAPADRHPAPGAADGNDFAGTGRKARRRAQSRPAPEPVKPQPQAKPAPSKPTIQSKPALQPAKTQADAPAPAKAISVAAAPAAPAPAAEAPKSAGGKADSRDLPVTEPLAHGGYLNNPAPAYPTVSREEGEEGTVRLRVHVSAQGLPQEVSVQSSSGFPRLDRAALAAVKRWRFIRQARRRSHRLPLHRAHRILTQVCQYMNVLTVFQQGTPY
ncbi:TonB family C-terminal domain [Chromobacterium violaceum]|uniref:TonB family C-terminal domain n=1 Tax=Chromobacterium violaceum TaxID=536 RepID=A0A3S4IWF2_CHRVL|nr:TonB family C-terminal domain [Chromobacterium violaceum]